MNGHLTEGVVVALSTAHGFTEVNHRFLGTKLIFAW